MCGIAGFVDFNGHLKEEAERALKAMTDVISHRGPDAQGQYVDNFAALGHRRLSIIDLEGGAQPMADETGRYIIVFNGEIYNFLDIRKELESKGYTFQTRSDTEVILKSYMEWGKGAIERLCGMFAFAIWDRDERTLFLARDRIGKKPLYVYEAKGKIAFSSEIKSILTLGVERALDLEATDCYFSFGYIPSPRTIFKSIRKIPPAHYVLKTPERSQEKRYWDISFKPREMAVEEALDEGLFPVLRCAVRERLISDVPLGAFLSGGIDSPLVVALMKEFTEDRILTNTIGFSTDEFNEAQVARKIARHLATDHREFTVTPQVKDLLPKIAWHFDEPLADSSAVPTYYVCAMARENVTVAISGDGGDEGFGGYTFRYIPHLWESRLRAILPNALRCPLFSLVARLYPRSARLPRPLRLKTIFENLSVSDSRAFYKDLVWLPDDIRYRVYSPNFQSELAGFTPFEIVHPLYEHVKGLDPVTRAQYCDMHLYLPEDVLVKVDRMSMAVALEVRAPLLDHRVLEFAATLPLSLKIAGKRGKILLREAVTRFLPRDLMDRPKQGFSIPEAKWLREDLREFVEGALSKRDSILRELFNEKEIKHIWEKHVSGRENHSVFFWAYMMLSFWEDNFLRGTLDGR